MTNAKTARSLFDGNRRFLRKESSMESIIAESSGETIGFLTFAEALKAYVQVHDAAVRAVNIDPHSDESIRLSESERAARNTVLRICIKVGRDLLEGKP
jgi:hypothetical protein